MIVCNSCFFFLASLSVKDGKNAASLFVAEQYISAFNKLARTNNTLILPSNAGDVTSLVAQAMSIYKTISNSDSNANNNNPLNDSENNVSSEKSTSTFATVDTKAPDDITAELFLDNTTSDSDAKKSKTTTTTNNPKDPLKFD